MNQIHPHFRMTNSQKEADKMSLLTTRLVSRFTLVFKNKRRLTAIFRTLILTVCIFTLVIYQSLRKDLRLELEMTGTQQQRDVKSILIWNAAERAEVVAFVTSAGGGRNVFMSCPITECRIDLASGTETLDTYDAVVVNFNDQFRLADVPNFRRKPHQRMVFFTQEPPPALKGYDFRRYANYFNWTMTYRTDSDIPFTYGRIRKRERTLASTEMTRPGSKTKLVAWMATQCLTDGRRESYIRELRRYIDVDVYGLCGRLSCVRHPVDISHPRCYDKLESTYKFYLSFENSICRDYVTEKFFKIMERRIVPVVYGGADYERIAPAGSYIDARRYTPAQLAEYLRRLDANETLYEEFFRWKKDYDVEAGVTAMARRGFCGLCSRLHRDKAIKTYADLASPWQHPSDECQSPLEIY